ncbi:MAG TPA: FecR domain-containing protein [Candidatus Binatia bacterium]|nr:FecR domain-containing protein [Candidatus Binatia bacterium]
MIRLPTRLLLVFLSLPALCGTAFAADAGRIKTVAGAVTIERGAQSLPAKVGLPVQVSDRIVTGADGSVGISFADDSLLSAGPNSSLRIDQFVYGDPKVKPAFESTLQRGTLSAVSGKIVKQAPGAMRVRTPTTILGVRGTDFVVEVSDAPAP